MEGERKRRREGRKGRGIHHLLNLSSILVKVMVRNFHVISENSTGLEVLVPGSVSGGGRI